MQTYLLHDLPHRNMESRDAEYLALDLETTGLDASLDAILSIGCVPIVGMRVRLREAQHVFVNAERDVEQSATIHGITDTEREGGVALEEALADVLGALAGRVLLAHYSPLDVAFLDAACRTLYATPLSVRVVDTLTVQQRRERSRSQDHREGGLRLHALRSRYGLPRYPAHDALSDALATAELFLAQHAQVAGSEPLPLSALLV